MKTPTHEPDRNAIHNHQKEAGMQVRSSESKLSPHHSAALAVLFTLITTLGSASTAGCAKNTPAEQTAVATSDATGTAKANGTLGDGAPKTTTAGSSFKQNPITLGQALSHAGYVVTGQLDATDPPLTLLAGCSTVAGSTVPVCDVGEVRIAAFSPDKSVAMLLDADVVKYGWTSDPNAITRVHTWKAPVAVTDPQMKALPAYELSDYEKSYVPEPPVLKAGQRVALVLDPGWIPAKSIDPVNAKNEYQVTVALPFDGTTIDGSSLGLGKLTPADLVAQVNAALPKAKEWKQWAANAADAQAQLDKQAAEPDAGTSSQPTDPAAETADVVTYKADVEDVAPVD